MEGVKGTDDYLDVQLASIVGPEVTSGCLDATSGTRYIEAARLTGGLVGNICESDWSGILYDLGLNAVGIHTTFELAHDGGYFNGSNAYVAIPADPDHGFTYDAEYFTITFHGDSVPERGAAIEAYYEIVAGT